MKQAILVVSFGTTHLDTLEQNISRLEQSVAQQFPEFTVFRAFTSPTIRARLESRHGIRVPSVEQALEQIISEGFGEVILQAALLIPGEEYERILESVKPFVSRVRIRMGRPLLWDDADLDAMVQLLRQSYCPDGQTVLLMMGHGTEHPANELFVRLAQKMQAEQGCCMRLCTVKGTPTFEDAIAELKMQPRRRVLTAPMMLVAGDHACNDMAGDEPDSLRSMLEQAGFAVECRIQGLGQLKLIRELYAQRIRSAEAI